MWPSLGSTIVSIDYMTPWYDFKTRWGAENNLETTLSFNNFTYRLVAIPNSHLYNSYDAL